MFSPPSSRRMWESSLTFLFVVNMLGAILLLPGTRRVARKAQSEPAIAERGISR